MLERPVGARGSLPRAADFFSAMSMGAVQPGGCGVGGFTAKLKVINLDRRGSKERQLSLIDKARNWDLLGVMRTAATLLPLKHRRPRGFGSRGKGLVERGDFTRRSASIRRGGVVGGVFDA